MRRGGGLDCSTGRWRWRRRRPRERIPAADTAATAAPRAAIVGAWGCRCEGLPSPFGLWTRCAVSLAPGQPAESEADYRTVF